MPDAYLIGTSCTRFGKQPGASFKDLTRQAYLAVLADAGLADGAQIGNAWFGNCGMGSWGQRNIRGQVCFSAAGARRPVPRAGGHDQCGRRLRHRQHGAARCLEGRAVGHGRAEPGPGRGKDLRARQHCGRCGCGGSAPAGDLRRRHRPARPGRLDGLLRGGGRRSRQALPAQGRRRHAVHGHLCDAGCLAHQAPRQHARTDRLRRQQEPRDGREEPAGAVPLRSHAPPRCWPTGW